MSTIGTIIGGGVASLAGAGINNAISYGLSRASRKENFEYNEAAANLADKRTRALYNDLQSPQALLEQYKEAGLSPSIMMSGGAQGSVPQGAQSEGASGLHAQAFGVNMLEAAQIAKMKAETENIEANTKNVEGIAGATISSLLADAGYKEAAAKAAEAQATSTELDNYVKEYTKNANIYKIRYLAEESKYNAQKAFEEVKQAQIATTFEQETLQNRMKIVDLQMQEIAQSIAESKSMEKLNDQQRAFVKDQILQNISTTKLEWAKYDLTVEKFDTFIEKQIPLLEQELNVRLGELDLAEKRLVVDAVVESFKGLCIGAATASTIGKGGNLTPPAGSKLPTYQRGGNAVPKGAPIYKTNTVWQY